jgi:hypothetical protein
MMTEVTCPDTGKAEYLADQVPDNNLRREESPRDELRVWEAYVQTLAIYELC